MKAENAPVLLCVVAGLADAAPKLAAYPLRHGLQVLKPIPALLTDIAAGLNIQKGLYVGVG